MAAGANSFNIGQYLRARNICPDSLRLELGENGRVRLEFDTELFSNFVHSKGYESLNIF